MKRSATAVWHGPGKEGKGNLTTQSKSLHKALYFWGSRFDDEAGTNPEELIAAAHAGCFTMQLSFLIEKAGFTPDTLETISTVTLEDGNIISSHLNVKGNVPGMNEQAFNECAEQSKNNCPVSKLLKAKITLESKLSAHQNG